MSFAFPSLLWFGLPLLAGVLAIHLLNLRRQKPIRWAAMDFLLESERVNKAWVNLRQWLLLAARMLAIALAVFALAKPQLKKFTLSALADSRVLHVIVLDDSYSMADDDGATSAWRDAIAAVDHVLEFASEHPQHSVALVRTSQRDESATLRGEGDQELARLRSLAADWRPSQVEAPLLPALHVAQGICEAAPTGARAVAYIVTDGRRKEVEPLAETSRRLETLQTTGAEVRWVSCVAAHHPNLTIASLEPLPGPLAAGVEVRMQVAVTNHGPSTADGALVQITRDGRSSPAIDLGRVEPGQTATRQFSLLLREPGEHRVTARLEPDAVSDDNSRCCVLRLASERKLLLVDGSPAGREGLPFAAALRPNHRLNTGWNPELVRPEKIDGSTGFDRYAAVFLLDVPRLSDATASALVEYVRHGGGLFISLGENAERGFYRQWLLGGGPHAVVPLTIGKQVRPPRGEGGDLEVSPHPVFNVFAGDRDSFLGLVAINYLHEASLSDDPASDFTRVIARHSSGAPLVVESDFGEGRAMALLTSIGQKQRQDESWSNLSTLPVFPVLALEIAAQLSDPKLHEPPLAVGGAWPTPGPSGPESRVRISRIEDAAAVEVVEAALNELPQLPGPQESGYYRVAVESAQGASDVLVAANVDPAEGDLRLAPSGDLPDALARLGVSVETAVALSASAGDDGPSPLPPLLAIAVIGLLIGEQILGVAASYHAAQWGAAR